MTNVVNNNDQRLKYLIYKIKNKTATTADRQEYLDLLLSGGHINNADYNKYKLQVKNSETGFGDLLIGLGVAVLIGALVGELFKGKR